MEKKSHNQPFVLFFLNRLKNDRARQEQLAKQRIEAMKNRKKKNLSTIAEEDEQVIDNGDRATMQVYAIKILF